MIPKVLSMSASVAQQLAVGAVHVGISGATAVVRKVVPLVSGTSGPDRPDTSSEAPAPAPAPGPAPGPVSTERETSTTPGVATPASVAAATKAPAKKAPAKKAPAKKAPAKKAAAKKAPAKKAPAASKPAAVLDEPTAPVDDNPVVYSSGPESTPAVPAEELQDLRPES